MEKTRQNRPEIGKHNGHVEMFPHNVILSIFLIISRRRIRDLEFAWNKAPLMDVPESLGLTPERKDSALYREVSGISAGKARV